MSEVEKLKIRVPKALWKSLPVNPKPEVVKIITSVKKTPPPTKGLIEQQNESDAHEESSLEQHPLEASHNLSIGSQTPHYSSDDEHSEGEVRGLSDTQELLQITGDTLEGMDMNTQELLGISDLENSQLQGWSFCNLWQTFALTWQTFLL